MIPETVYWIPNFECGKMRIAHWAGVAYYKWSGHSTALCSKSDGVIRQHWDNVQSIQL